MRPEKVTEALPSNVHTEVVREQPNDGQLSALPYDNPTNECAIRRPSRTRKPPDRLGVYIDVDSALSEEGVFTDRNKYKNSTCSRSETG